MTIMKRFRLRSLAADQSGAAAVEFALVLPFMAAIVIGIATVAPLISAHHAMRDGVSAGSLYVMSGGRNATTIRDVTLAAWTGHTDSDTVTVTQYCTCGDVEGSCTTLCGNGVVPSGYTRIEASTVFSGLGGTKSLSAHQLVRTR
jgi:Flp pilus assembly protein TadG